MIALVAVLVFSGVAAAQSEVSVASDSLHNTKVYDTDGKQIGSINRLMIDPHEGRVTGVLIKQGGMAGMGGKEVSVPWNALKLQRGEKGLVVTMQKDILEKAQPAASPATDKDQPRR